MKLSTAVEIDQTLQQKQRLAYLDIPQSVYRATQAVSISTIKSMGESPAKCRWDLDHPREPSPAQSLGTAIHMALLEPDLFQTTYVELPKFDRRTKAGKEAAAEFEAANGGKEVLDRFDMMTVERIHKRTYDCAFFQQFFKTGQKEKSFFTRHDETKLMLRCRPDNIIDTSFGRFIVDLKTTDDASDFAFSRSILRYGYLNQAAWYMDVVTQTTGERPAGYVIVAVEKSRDCDMGAFYFTDEDLTTAHRQNQQWLATFARCLETGIWPGYPRDFKRFKMPEWQRELIEQQTFSQEQ